MDKTAPAAIATLEDVEAFFADDEPGLARFVKAHAPAPLRATSPRTKGGKIEYADLPLEIKAIDEETGEFSGVISTDDLDLGKDIVLPTAFKRTLDHSKGKVPILWFHDPMQPVGIGIEASIEAHSIPVKGQVDLNTERGRDMRSGMKMGYINCMSIGYEIPKGGSETKDGIRTIKELILVEYSLLTAGFAMQPNALVDLASVKAVGDFNTALEVNVELEAIRKRMYECSSRRWRMSSALSDVISDLQNEDTLTNDEKVGALRASMAQYTEAMCTWLGDWLAIADEMKAAVAGDAEGEEDVTEELDDVVGWMSRDFAAMLGKAGRRNSASDEALIKQAIECLQQVIDNAEESPDEAAPTEKSREDVSETSTDRDDEPTGADAQAAKEADIDAKVKAIQAGMIAIQNG